MSGILVVDDDVTVGEILLTYLKHSDLEGQHVESASELLARLDAMEPDLLVLDVMLPDGDGMALCAQVRTSHPDLPVILLTARSELDERLEGLNLGADDYLTKPFYIEELVARLHTIVRRAGGEADHLLKVGDLTLDRLHHMVKRDGEEIPLSVREYSLLEYLMQSPGRVLTRTQICEHVWNYGFDPETNLVDVYIQRLRKKVDQGFSSRLIETVRGVGYRIAETTDA